MIVSNPEISSKSLFVRSHVLQQSSQSTARAFQRPTKGKRVKTGSVFHRYQSHAVNGVATRSRWPATSTQTKSPLGEIPASADYSLLERKKHRFCKRCRFKIQVCDIANSLGSHVHAEVKKLRADTGVYIGVTRVQQVESILAFSEFTGRRDFKDPVSKVFSFQRNDILV